MDQNKLSESLKEMGIPDHLICLLRNLYTGQEATVRSRHETGSKLKKEYIKTVYSHPAYLTYESQTGIKTAGRNINNLKYADDTTLLTESEEELKSLLMKVKEKIDKVGLKLNIKNTKLLASGPITTWQIDSENNRNNDGLYFLGLQNHCGQ